ncbi:MAG: efflux RND transporter periplasmic adaptor subunit [Candidatus Omnitrophica bacterium]|nr:efflux RND transporter periplasmic adaptor subunit [Candidatus Omnitrophota bacterium]
MFSKNLFSAHNITPIIAIVFLLIAGTSVSSCSRKKTATHDEEKKQIIEYYTCGMHPSVKISQKEFNEGNTLCPICNMKLIPVYRKPETKDSTAKGKVLFYRNPMNPGITSQEPAKDEMGMDYVPVYEQADDDTVYYGCGMKGQDHVYALKGKQEGMTCPICKMPLKKLSEQEADNLRGVIGKVTIKSEETSLAGVKTEIVKKQKLFHEIRAVGKVAYDPDLAIAQDEFVSALNAYDVISEGTIPEIKDRAKKLVNASENKLKLLGLSEEQIKQLAEKKDVQTNLVLPDKTMWVYGDVYESEMNWLKIGDQANIITESLPGQELQGIVSSINPIINPKTRTLRFRVEVDNPELKLKPEMYVDVFIMSMYETANKNKEVLTISANSLLDTGIRKLVWVHKGNNEYEGREVIVGPRSTAIIDQQKVNVYPVLQGLDEGELVVKKANFLIDSQSQISGTVSASYSGALDTDKY